MVVKINGKKTRGSLRHRWKNNIKKYVTAYVVIWTGLDRGC